MASRADVGSKYVNICPFSEVYGLLAPLRSIFGCVAISFSYNANFSGVMLLFVGFCALMFLRQYTASCRKCASASLVGVGLFILSLEVPRPASTSAHSSTSKSPTCSTLDGPLAAIASHHSTPLL